MSTNEPTDDEALAVAAASELHSLTGREWNWRTRAARIVLRWAQHRNTEPPIPAPGPPSAESEAYLLVSMKWTKGYDACFWRPDGRGYTINLDEAGRYTKAEAARQLLPGSYDVIAVPASEAEAAAVRRVRDSDAFRWLQRQRDADATPATSQKP